MSRFVTLGLCLLLSACASVPKTPPLADLQTIAAWEPHYEAVKQHTRWTLKGKISIRSSSFGENASFTWQQHNDDAYTLHLYGPLGSYHTVITGSSDEVILKASTGEMLTGQSPEDLMLEALGWEAPLSYLHDWVRGIPTDALSYVGQADPQGMLYHLQQAGWDIDFSDYQDQRPGRLTMYQGGLKVKVIASAWEIGF